MNGLEFLPTMVELIGVVEDHSWRGGCATAVSWQQGARMGVFDGPTKGLDRLSVLSAGTLTSVG